MEALTKGVGAENNKRRGRLWKRSFYLTNGASPNGLQNSAETECPAEIVVAASSSAPAEEHVPGKDNAFLTSSASAATLA